MFQRRIAGFTGLSDWRTWRSSVGRHRTSCSHNDRGENGWRAKARRLLQPLLGCEGRESSGWKSISGTRIFVSEWHCRRELVRTTSDWTAGSWATTRIVRFERSGPKVLLVQENLDFRAVTTMRMKSARCTTRSQSRSCGDLRWRRKRTDHVLVDATDFSLRDAHGVPHRRCGAPSKALFRLDATRCAIYLPHTKNFPLNTEVEATLTFTGDEPGRWVRDVTPVAGFHHCARASFVCAACRRRATSRAFTIRDRVSSGFRTWTMRRRSASRS